MIQQLSRLLCSATVCVETEGDGIFQLEKIERNELVLLPPFEGTGRNFREAVPVPECNGHNGYGA
jgi:hypothetical protein